MKKVIFSLVALNVSGTLLGVCPTDASSSSSNSLVSIRQVSNQENGPCSSLVNTRQMVIDRHDDILNTTNDTSKKNKGKNADLNPALSEFFKEFGEKEEVNSTNIKEYINKQYKNGDTPLILAIKSRNEEIAKLLVENGADVNQQNKNGNTPLMLAIRGNNEKIFEILLERKDVNVNQPSKDGNTPLIEAFFWEYEKFVKSLIEKGADINQANSDGDTPLTKVIDWGNEDIVKLLVEKGADVNQANSNGDTPLTKVIDWGNEDIVKLLVEKGADVNQVNSNGDTPLIYAVDTNEINKNEKIIEYLLNSKADVEVINKLSNNPFDILEDVKVINNLLFKAIEWGNKNIVKVLVDKVDIEKTDAFGNTALMYAVYHDKDEIVKFLINKNAKVNIENYVGTTPLMHAVYHGCEDIVEILVNNGADLNKSDLKGYTPLMRAIYKGNREIVRILLVHGADFEKVDYYFKRTALHWAVIYRQTDIVRLLLGFERTKSKGRWTSLNYKDAYGKTPFDYAKEKKYEEIVNLLVTPQINYLYNGLTFEDHEKTSLKQKVKSVLSKPVIKFALGGAAVIGGGVLTYYALNKILAFGAGNAQINKEIVDYVAHPTWNMFKEKAKTVLRVMASKKVMIPLAGYGWWYWLSNSESDLEEA